jgi:hypothetical protein
MLCCAASLVCPALGWAGGLEDGIYFWTTGPGKTVKRNDGAEVVLGHRLGQPLGKASIRSVTNDNSKYVLELKGAGPVAKEPGGYLAVVVDGVLLAVWGQSDREADGTMNLSCHIYGDEAAQKVAARLQVEPKKRKNPGHRFEVRWTPEKESFQAGEPVTLKLEIRNAGEVPFAFRVGGQQRGPRDNQFRFLAYRSYGGGKAVPDTGDPVNFGGISTFHTLKPGETFTRSVGLDKWFNLSEPDIYRITGIYQLELVDPEHGFGEVLWNDLAIGDCFVRVIK